MTEPPLPKILLLPNFISLEQCVALMGQMNDAPVRSTTIAAQGTSQVKREIRRALKIEIPNLLLEGIERKLKELIPNLREYFEISITHWQTLQALRYQPGDFYKVHKDNGNLRIQEVGEVVSPVIAKRKLTAVIFLNGQVDSGDKESFAGGELVLHSKSSITDLEDSLLPISPKPGLLVAFPSSTLHEVIPVVSGIRHSIVSWIE